MPSFVNPFSGASVWYKEKTGSTMDDARACIRSGCSHGTVTAAGFQESGRGRFRERRWEGAAGKNLLFSLILERSKLSGEVSLLPLTAGLAVCETITRMYTIELGIKWPNDVLWQGKKVCGILCESVEKHVIAGVGVNCNQTQFPGELKGKAVSLAEIAGQTIDTAELLENLLDMIKSLIICRDIPARVNEVLLFRGEMMTVSTGITGNHQRVSGVCGGVGTEGELILHSPDSDEVKRLFSGEATLL